MKIDINKLKVAPITPFSLCVYGPVDEETKDWINYWKLETNTVKEFTNISFPKGVMLESMFNAPKIYDYMDGFSPNLNKHLHVGHLSNLALAKAFQNLKISKKTVAIFGDTLTGDVKQDDALNVLEKYCKIFDYHIDEHYYASNMKLIDFSKLEFATDDDGIYAKTKFFNFDGQKVVAIKSDGSTTYTYQDVALAQKLNAPTLYLTGFEQNQHFDNLKKWFPNNDHIGLGLLTIDGKKMSSSEGNVIFAADFINLLLEKFNNDYPTIWNIFACAILKNDPISIKKIDTKLIDNAKQSPGLYISYTMAKMNSAGVELIKKKTYDSVELQYSSLKAKINLKPNLLLTSLIDHCKNINQLYETHIIKDNVENKKLFQNLVYDLVLAVEELGLFIINKI